MSNETATKIVLVALFLLVVLIPLCGICGALDHLTGLGVGG